MLKVTENVAPSLLKTAATNLGAGAAVASDKSENSAFAAEVSNSYPPSELTVANRMYSPVGTSVEADLNVKNKVAPELTVKTAGVNISARRVDTLRLVWFANILTVAEVAGAWLKVRDASSR